MKICTSIPATYYSAEPNTTILDGAGFLFYTHPNHKKNLYFNLPAGCYYTNNTIEEAPQFKPYNYIKGQEPKNDFNRDIQIILTENPHKATIYPKHGFILFDKALTELHYKPIKTFILAHEIGHKYTKDSEEGADEYGANLMLRAGYNPSQIATAARLLFKFNQQRKNNLIYKLKEYAKR